MQKIYSSQDVFLVLGKKEEFYSLSQGLSVTQEMNSEGLMTFFAYWYDMLNDRLISWPLAKEPEIHEGKIRIIPQVGYPLVFLLINKSVYDTYLRKKGILRKDLAPELPDDQAVQQYMSSFHAYQEFGNT